MPIPASTKNAMALGVIHRMANGTEKMRAALADLLSNIGVGESLDLTADQQTAVLDRFGGLLNGKMFASAKANFNLDDNGLRFTGATEIDDAKEDVGPLHDLYAKVYPQREKRIAEMSGGPVKFGEVR